MKTIIVLFIISFNLTFAFAQNLEVSEKSYGGGYSLSVIKPSITNFKILLSLDESQFESTMKRYKYFEEGSSGKYRTFWNGSLDNFAYAKCVNTFLYNIMRNEIRYFVSSDMIYPSDAITSLFRYLKPYYIKSGTNSDGNSTDNFSISLEGYNYDFFITSGNTYDIMVIRKPLN